MVLPPGRKPLTDEEIAKMIELCEFPPPLTEHMKEAAKRFRDAEFEIESLDPAERSWYYDGAGIKRPKSQSDE
jgi:hypothetical protein